MSAPTATGFTVYPAIDLQGGRCVRLVQGDFARATTYGEDPAAVARRWRDGGAQWLHVVDLDAARDGNPANLDAVAAIVAAAERPVQCGGGLRSVEAAERLFQRGVARVVVGTAAIEQPDLLPQLAARWPGRVALGVDARGGRVAVRGWTETSAVLAVDLISQWAELPLAAVIYTDIARDGTLTEPNWTELASVIATSAAPVIASGGVAQLDHLRRIKGLGAAGAIVGKALYTGDVDLTAALALDEGTRKSDEF